jgi:hypothetical protein
MKKAYAKTPCPGTDIPIVQPPETQLGCNAIGPLRLDEFPASVSIDLGPLALTRHLENRNQARHELR